MRKPFFIVLAAYLYNRRTTKVKPFFAPLVLLALFGAISAALPSCGGTQIELPEQRLTGSIDGQEWDMKFANAYIFSSDLKYQLKFLSTAEGGDDPCAVPFTANTHVSIIMPLQIRSYSLPLPIVEESARFQFSNGSSAIATSGFLEIYDIVNARVFGYMQAQLDDDNTVEGSFEAFICN